MAVPEDVGSKKMTAALLAIFLGAFGAHKFYLGLPSAVIHLLLMLVCLSGLIGLIEGIIYLTKSNEDFYQQYIVDKKAWF